jgi:hypothetical protein
MNIPSQVVLPASKPEPKPLEGTGFNIAAARLAVEERSTQRRDQEVILFSKGRSSRFFWGDLLEAGI